MRWRKALVAVVVFLVTLELVLQVGALAMAMFFPRAGLATHGAVLCVGDSFTFGVGARSLATSYPSQLTVALAARGIPGVGVDNAGFPGQHSGDVLSKLPSQLLPSTKVICVLVGINDSWRRPARVDLAELARGPAAQSTGWGFQWRWRTARLLQLLTRFETDTWQQTGDGRAMPGIASTAGASVGPTAEDTATGFAELARWGLSAGSARIGRYEPDRTLPQSRNDTFRKLMEAGDFLQACTCAEQSARDHPGSPLALQQVVTAAARTGQREKAMAAADRLAELHKVSRSAAAAECLAEAYVTTGQPELAIAIARRRIAEQPLSIMAWDCLQRAAFVLGRREDALQAMPETIRLLGRSEPSRTGFIARNFARWWLESEPDKAIGLLVGAHFVDANVEETRIALVVAAPAIERRQFDAALAAIGNRDRKSTQALTAILDEVYADRGAEQWGAVLREHLIAMHDIARRRGIELVILSYPFLQRTVEQQQREAARALSVPFLPIRERFDRELRTRPRADLFVADGHCSDAGYAIVAEMVAEVVAPLLAR